MRYRSRKKEIEHLRVIFEKELQRAQIEIQEQTFHTISQEIHDNVGQTLSLAKVQVNIIDQSETTDKELLADIKENISKAMNDLRDLAKNLNSDHIQLHSLKELIEPELLRLQRSKIIETSITETDTSQSIAHQKKLILFRMVQEALQNIIKHASASTITVHLHYKNDVVDVTIADDGKGFETDKINGDGLGLQNIASRAKLIGGSAAVESSPGKGCTLTLTIPYA